MKSDGVVLLKTLEKRQASHLFWAPQGGFILLAGLRSADGGHLEFFNVNDLETMATEVCFIYLFISFLSLCLVNPIAHSFLPF